MRLWSISQQAIHRRCLGAIQRDVALRRILQPNKERLRTLQRICTEGATVPNLELIRKLADKRPMFAARTPDGNIGLASHPIAKIKHANVLQNLLDDGVAHQLDLFFWG